MASDYMSQLADATGLPYYPKQGPFGQKDGAVVGAKEGFLVAIGPAKAEGARSAIGVLLRFRKTTDIDPLRLALKQNPELTSRGKLEKAGEGFLRWMWAYSFGKPKPEEVTLLVNALVEAAKHNAQPFDERCESCESARTKAIVLLNAIPVYYCEGCQQKLQADLDAAGRAYEETAANLPNGLLFGVLAAAGGSLAWGIVAYSLKRIFLIGGILIGYLVAWAVIKGMGKINRAGQVLVFLLTIASVLFGDVIFYTLVAMKELSIPLSGALVRKVLANLWRIETSARGGLASVLFAFVGAGYALKAARKPQFKAKFERLGQPAS